MTFLTRHEKYVIIFLLAGAICGAGYSYYQKFHPPIRLRFRKNIGNKPVLRKDLDGLLKKEKSVNINSASAEELMKLSGIGPAMAGRIVEYRMANGPFKGVEDIKKVKGIGPKKFDAVKDYIKLE
ncbi:MAG: helix-hairpin-helix domain-containing protein [Candidatus Omnitrophota bacterium]|nr:helix-hairpin-helix domain-containing protein [Candidatus Omnitrophota bacterium]